MESLDENVVLESVEYTLKFENVPSNVKTRPRVSDVLFANAIQECGSILLHRRQTSQIKELKKNAVKDVMDYILVQENITVSEEHIYKKLHNMKARVRSKTESCQTGNKHVQLNEVEKIVFNLMATVENTTVSNQKCKFHMNFKHF